ncbi:MAG TPA: hypothetical protein VNO52_15130, partial [Methylomirabilota bacterium]|nr:hypothetical protein [Methylomirabilota bacterium]
MPVGAFVATGCQDARPGAASTTNSIPTGNPLNVTPNVLVTICGGCNRATGSVTASGLGGLMASPR